MGLPDRSAGPLWGRLWRQLGRRRRRQLALASGLMLLSGALEMVSVAAVAPLLVGLMQWGQGARIWVAWLFCGAVVAAALVRLANLQVTAQLAAAIGADLGEAAFRRTLGRPYGEHLLLDGSRVVAILAPQQRQLITQVLQQGLQLVSATLLAVAIVGVLAALAWQVLLPVALVVAVSYSLLTLASRARLRRQGREAVGLQRQLIRLIQDNLAAIRSLLLRGGAETVAAGYGAIERRMRRLEAANSVLTALPRYLLEPLGMVGIAFTGLVLLARGQTPLQVLPTLGLLAFAAQRLLPLSQQIWVGWASLTSGTALLEDLLGLLERPEILPRPPLTALEDWRRVALEGVSFAYAPEAGPVLLGFELQLDRGEWLGLWGPSGAGKSTVLDLLLGLLPADRGHLRLDGAILEPESLPLRRWQAGLAHVGQAVPLVAGTVAANVALGAGESGLELAQLAALAELTGLTELLGREVGEAGRSLSGGQRQRVGLARALAAPLSLLVLDEATSALDLEAERQLLTRLRVARPHLTLLLVSHRRASLELCDRVLDLRASHG
ncbi:ATP-binding cassette domain-containing protein [Cyanobium sp. ATX 6F1]|uniref:ATP-binding cassette domain-containing protein n=1 Tax=Cyanobium sp. ATX 6F1 TaxID=2823702 RepID=UPI0020CECFDB|nr:ABC transporter ATP-binding protein [Cyanobium sp. ATX 6F1]MCP9917454.1 ABC transporter ATP-binding protein [Cyanobium sp. ATX 6F1]